MNTRDPIDVSLSFLGLAEGVRSQARIMGMDVVVDDQPTREELDAIVALNEARPAGDGARAYFAWLLEQTIAELDKPIPETRMHDVGMVAEAVFHDDDGTDALFERLARRHDEDEAVLRREVEEMNDATRALIEAERD